MKQTAVQVVQVQMHVDTHVESLVEGQDFSPTEIGTCADLGHEPEDIAQSVLTPDERSKRLGVRTLVDSVYRRQRRSFSLQSIDCTAQTLSPIFPIEVSVVRCSITSTVVDCHDVQFAKA